MSKTKIFGITTLFLISSFIYSPVFAENPVNIEIIEITDDGSGTYIPFHDITGAMPGETFSLIPQIINNGTIATDVEVCIKKSGQDSNGTSIVIPNDTFIYTINDHWIPNGETDCYKYDESLIINSITEPLFNSVTINSNIGNDYHNSTFNLTLIANAIGDNPDNSEESSSITPNSPNTGSNTFTTSILPTASIMTIIIISGIIVVIRKKTK